MVFAVLIMIVIFNSVVSSSLFVSDQCISVCKHADLPSLEQESYEQVVCQRGCGFFSAIKFHGDVNYINVSKKECHISCEESYITKEEKSICKTGCNLVAKQEVFVIKSEENIVLARSPEREIEFGLSLLSDPRIKDQHKTDVDYKIPETHIRTMPIEIAEEDITVRESRDWLDCASYNSGIPRWILLTAILSAVLVALWLSFSTEKRGNREPTIMLDITNDKMILIQDNVEKDSKLQQSPSIYNNQEVNFSIPPKYTVECEKV